MGSVIYCNFSFKRPKGKGYGLFAVAMYRDIAGKKLIVKKTKRLNLWKDHQFITAIQSYYNALATIYEMQGLMIEANVRQVMLVTDNSILAGWIESPNKNKKYSYYMNEAVKLFRAGGPNEIVVGVGLCNVMEREYSYKFCKEELVEDEVEKIEIKSSGNRLNIDNMGEVKSVMDFVEEE